LAPPETQRYSRTSNTDGVSGRHSPLQTSLILSPDFDWGGVAKFQGCRGASLGRGDLQTHLLADGADTNKSVAEATVSSKKWSQVLNTRKLRPTQT
jgi:hypothetical protein